MATSSSSELTLDQLRDAVRGDGRHPGLAFVLPLLQTRHRRELVGRSAGPRRSWSATPSPRQLIRRDAQARQPDDQGLPIYTLDERRYSTADIRENRLVWAWTKRVRAGLEARADTDPEAEALLAMLGRAIGKAPFLQEVGPPDPRQREMTTTLLQDPLYRAVVALRA